ncbi:hypothetical protein [Tenacibaculum xiamenense]|uniref:hypothetical protein n=1 Tax=Tenacibaculum xiamenense TaxID=1261553 RepID=UPI0038B66F2E
MFLIYYFFIRKISFKKDSELGIISDFLKNRRTEPLKSFSYWLYFILIVFFIGITGSLISAFPSYVNGQDEINSTSLSLIGYAVVLLCSSSIELIFIKFRDHERDKYLPVQNGIIMIGVSLVIISILIGLVTYMIESQNLKLAISIIACLFAMYFWWITNSTNSSVFESITPPTTDSTTGGEPNNLNGVIPKEFTE